MAEDTETTTETSEAAAEIVVDAKALQAEVDKWKETSRKWETRSKENLSVAQKAEAARLEALPEAERMVEEARAQARAEVLTEVASARVEDAVRLASAGRTVDVDALLEGLDKSRFLTKDFTPDTAAIAKWIDRVAPAAEKQDPARGPLDLGQGDRGRTPALNDDDALLGSLNAVLGIG